LDDRRGKKDTKRSRKDSVREERRRVMTGGADESERMRVGANEEGESTRGTF